MENHIRIKASDKRISYVGRFLFDEFDEVVGDWSGISATIKFRGTSLNVKLFGSNNYFNVIMNDEIVNVIDCEHDKSGEYIVVENLPFAIHEVTIFKRTEPISGKVFFKEFSIDGEAFLSVASEDKVKIEFIGDSITAGYGNLDDSEVEPFKNSTEDNYYAYGAITARLLHAEYRTVCHSGKGVFRNYDQDNYQIIPDVYHRVIMYDESRFDFESWSADIVVVNLGTNDFAIEPPNSRSFMNAYYNFILNIRNLNPNCKIICCVGPLLNDNWPIDVSTGDAYHSLSMCKEYISNIISLAATNGINDIYLCQLTDKSAEFGYGADFHPNVRQAQYNAQELCEFIKREILTYEVTDNIV